MPYKPFMKSLMTQLMAYNEVFGRFAYYNMILVCPVNVVGRALRIHMCVTYQIGCVYISEVVLRFDRYSEHQAFYGYKANLNMVFTCSVKDKPNGIIMTEMRLELSLNFIT